MSALLEHATQSKHVINEFLLAKESYGAVGENVDDESSRVVVIEREFYKYKVKNI